MTIKNPKSAFAQTQMLALALSVLIAAVRPSDGSINTGITRDEFWWLKIHAEPIYDVVVAGDSRIMIDIDPSAMEPVVNGKALNFGFNFAGYTKAYLDAVESKLRNKDERSSILLGITPRSLTPLNMRVSAYESEAARPPFEQFQQRYLSGFFNYLRPISLSTALAQFRGKHFYRNHYANGFMSLELVPPNPREDLPTYEKVFDNNGVSQEHIDMIIERVAQWRAKGIRVFGFAPPVFSEIADAERESGFDQSLFISRFQKAGGVWLSNDKSDYLLADGSHLSAGEVGDYTRSLAEKMKR